MSSEIELAYDKALQFQTDGNREQALAAFSALIDRAVEADDADGIRVKELSINHYSDILSQIRKPQELIDLLTRIRPFFAVLPKAKTAKIVRKIFDNIISAGATLAAQEKVCLEMIDWTKAEKRTFLRHRLQLRLAQICFEQKESLRALSVINSLLREVRRLDDRTLLVDIHLVESCVYYSIRNISKSRAALVSARTNANAIYCPPLAQAEIDLQSGILHADEGDYKTAFSYLYEAFEGFHQLGDHAREARRTLTYMVLAKISCDNLDELNAVMTAKSVLEYTGREVDALRAVARAHKNKDVHDFNLILQDFADVLKNDQVIEKHLRGMYEELVERHMLRIIRPYNRVQIQFIADSMKLPVDVTESKLSQLILDKKLHGIQDQLHRCLIVFEDEDTSKQGPSIYEDALSTLENLDRVVTALFDKMAGKFDHLVEKAAADRKKKEEEKEKEKGKAKKSTEKEKKKESE